MVMYKQRDGGGSKRDSLHPLQKKATLVALVESFLFGRSHRGNPMADPAATTFQISSP